MQHGFCTYMQYIKVTTSKVQVFLKRDQSLTTYQQLLEVVRVI